MTAPVDAPLHLLRLALAGIVSGQPDPADIQKLRSDLERDDTGPETYHVLPLLTWLSGALQADDPLAGKLRGIKRLTWYRNQAVLAACERVQALLQTADIPTLLLGELASMHALYPEVFVRPLSGLVVLIPPDHSGQAISLLHRDGWIPVHNLMPVNPSFLEGQRFFHPAVDSPLELRWHALPVCLFPGSDDEFWQRARRVSGKDRQRLALAPADLLLYLSVQCRFEQGPPWLWFADAMRLIHAESENIDWTELLEAASRRLLILPLRSLLGFLGENFGLQPPAAVNLELGRRRVSRVESFEGWYRRKPADVRLAGNLPLLWIDHVRSRRLSDSTAHAQGFAAYLANYWRVGNSAELLSMLSRVTARRLGSRCRAGLLGLFRAKPV